MPNLLAKTAFVLIFCAGTVTAGPTTQPQASTLSGLKEAEQRMHQMDLELQKQINNLNQLESQLKTKPFEQIIPIQPSPAPYSAVIPSITNIHPYGPSFQFNGLTVHIEPINLDVKAMQQRTASSTEAIQEAIRRSRASAIEQQIDYFHHLQLQEPVAVVPDKLANAPSTHP